MVVLERKVVPTSDASGLRTFTYADLLEIKIAFPLLAAPSESVYFYSHPLAFEFAGANSNGNAKKRGVTGEDERTELLGGLVYRMTIYPPHTFCTAYFMQKSDFRLRW